MARGTLQNSLVRNGVGTPVKLSHSDFEVYRTEQMNQASTVLLLDLSRSMIYRGCFLAAKKVALALHSLIKSQFPRDNLYLVTFSLYARQIQPQHRVVRFRNRPPRLGNESRCELDPVAEKLMPN